MVLHDATSDAIYETSFGPPAPCTGFIKHISVGANTIIEVCKILHSLQRYSLNCKGHVHGLLLYTCRAELKAWQANGSHKNSSNSALNWVLYAAYTTVIKRLFHTATIQKEWKFCPEHMCALSLKIILPCPRRVRVNAEKPVGKNVFKQGIKVPIPQAKTCFLLVSLRVRQHQPTQTETTVVENLKTSHFRFSGRPSLSHTKERVL
ncbi:hypothetical protein CSKR_113197 [Clonorchis sinensis]|uniref:Uncharacterized protein n=1 Tax=Clonorchis sinensis TaxID=79923 RepID=A0A3R7H6P5_CLOSI|nr:hypothetical protein CSKR_113197 [Clonorchis sinensis]